MSPTIRTGGACVLAALSLSACATTEYVDAQVAGLQSQITAANGQIAALDGRVASHDAAVARLNSDLQATNKLAMGKFTSTSVSSDDSITFATNKWTLSDEAQATLTALAEKLKSENRNVYVEVIGHGDTRGSVYNNRILGEKRALETRRFLASQGVPLSRIETVSWGEERTKTAEGSAEEQRLNRRVQVVVVE